MANKTVFWIMLTTSLYASAAERFTFPQLPESPYADTEISTNVPFSTGAVTSRRFSLAIELDALSNSTVQVAFGTDSDSDGTLSWPETEFLLGWRCGGWFYRDKVANAENFLPREVDHRILNWTVLLNVNRQPHFVSAHDNGESLEFQVSRGMFNPRWNLARVTMRGRWATSYEISGGLFIPGFSVRIR